LLLSLVAATFLGMLPQATLGEPINYGSYTGTSVNFIDVTEDTTTGDSLPLFGTPVFSGNSMDFNPSGFDAEASGANGSDETGARLTFMLEAHAGDAITSISFREDGDTTLSGVGSDSTNTAVTASGTITINAVDGAAIAPIVRPISLTFTPSGGDYGLSTDGGGLPIYHTQWTGLLDVNIAQILSSAGLTPALGATKVSIDLANLLTAQSQAGTQALINKQDFGGISFTVNEPGGGGEPEIPEPASVCLVGAGLAGYVVGGRRRRQSA
jgi:hypothetical protein